MVSEVIFGGYICYLEKCFRNWDLTIYASQVKCSDLKWFIFSNKEPKLWSGLVVSIKFVELPILPHFGSTTQYHIHSQPLASFFKCLNQKYPACKSANIVQGDWAVLLKSWTQVAKIVNRRRGKRDQTSRGRESDVRWTHPIRNWLAC